MYPVLPPGGAAATGYSYGLLLSREPLPLREARFTGFVAPVTDGWHIAVAEPGTVASGRRGVLELGASLGGLAVLAVLVLGDRQLVLALGPDRYVSDPSYGLGRDVLPTPIGASHAAAFAAFCGRPAVADELAELLAEELDPDSVIESERLGAVGRLLGLPDWLVAVGSLPRDVPTGPPASAFTRLGAGSPGLPGRVRGRLAETVRRRRPPPPVVTDPPRMDPWMM